MSTYTHLIQQYLHLVETFETNAAAYQAILHPEILQTEFPNALVKSKVESDLSSLHARMNSGTKILKAQRFEISHLIELGETVVAEQIWTGEIGTDIGNFKTGQTLKAYICTIFEFKEGKIYRQRNYDCYEPF